MACIGEDTKARRILLGKTKMKEATWQVLGADGRIILKRIVDMGQILALFYVIKIFIYIKCLTT